MPSHDPDNDKFFADSSRVPAEVQDTSGARQTNFLGGKFNRAGAVIIVILLLSVFCALIAYFFLG